MATKVLGLALVFLMLPVFAGSICPCAHAAPAAYPVLQKAPCQGCCTAMNAAKSDCETQPEIQVANLSEWYRAPLSIGTRYHSITAEVLSFNIFPPAENVIPAYSFASHESLFLSLLNLRI